MRPLLGDVTKILLVATILQGAHFHLVATSSSNSNTESLRLLDQMLRKYDRRSTPTNDRGVATNVSVQLLVASMGSINTENMDYVTDVYLRQRWFDTRLSHQNMTEALDLADPNLVKAIWKPEVFFPNAKEANFQFVTVPNVLIRIHPNGEILYILRLRLKFSCMMELSRYPLDRQICDMQIASFSKTTRELLLHWDSSEFGSAVTVSSDLKMPQFIVESVRPTLCFERFHLDRENLFLRRPSDLQEEKGPGNYSCLVAHFYLKRSVSFHLIQSYLPSILIVAISWVSFWMDIEAVPGRISLGVITLLAVSSQAGQEKNVPQTSYVKAIDVWMGLCTAFVFAALVEFTIVNFWFRKFKRQRENALALMLPFVKTAPNLTNLGGIGTVDGTLNNSSKAKQKPQQSQAQGNHNFDMLFQGGKEHSNLEDAAMLDDAECGKVSARPPPLNPFVPIHHQHPAHLNNPKKLKPHPAELVDQASRGLFPLGFAICNVAYWLYYLYFTDQDLASLHEESRA